MENNTTQLRAAFFDMSHSPYIILDENLILIDINTNALANIPVNKKDIIGKKFTDLFPDAPNNRLNAYREVINTGVPIDVEEVKLCLPSGEFVFFVKVFRVGEGIGFAALNITKMINTIDSQKKVALKLKDFNTRLKQRNKDLEVFSYVAAHDIKAPLTNIHTLLSFLENEGLIKKSGRPVFLKVIQSLDIMTSKLKALNDVIALKYSLSEKQELVTFKEIITNVKSEISEDIKKFDVQIREDFSQCNAILYNPEQLHSVLQNLLTNSIKYRNPNISPIIKISTKKENGKCVLKISDNGIGINMKLGQNKMFGLFKRMHTHVEGLGVGLYIVKSIITSHGGSIKVTSKINQGTKFKIVL
ncbi:signal transduction histidine kinase [Saonia flava]|uniref:histidine kinase n=1 Tax=Saonia flava TaxID=523696 RepID=A0A846QMC7_9FLAO|nr:HAMP domain-containing sensor histidine kinase [Saonia flava]NJB70136.1 signal transduction histidine kinase [Saonia flava]